MVLPTTIVTMTAAIELPADLFYDYRVTATFYDVFQASTSTSMEFTALASTPVVSVTTTDITTIPLNIEVVADVTDASDVVGTWSCVTAADGECPSALTEALSANGTNSGVSIAGPIPAGHYTPWMTYKSMRSANVSLTVLCDAVNLTSANKCPGGCVYDCLDATSSLAACACTRNASIVSPSVSVWPVAAQAGELDASTALSFTAAGKYRQVSGSCSSFDLTPFMTLQWRVYRGSESAALSLPSVSNQSVAAREVLHGDGAVPRHQLEACTHGRVHVHGEGADVSASVTDVFADGTVGVWGCAVDGMEDACPTALTDALSANGTNTGVYIAGPVNKLRLAYKVASTWLAVVVSVTDVPRVPILSSVVPAVQPSTFLFAQSLSLRSAAARRRWGGSRRTGRGRRRACPRAERVVDGACDELGGLLCCPSAGSVLSLCVPKEERDRSTIIKKKKHSPPPILKTRLRRATKKIKTTF